MAALTGHWSANPVWLALLALAVLYLVGRRSVERTGWGPAGRAAMFYAALAVVAVAEFSSLGYYARSAYWGRAAQIMLLVLVVPVLVAFAAPWAALRAGLPDWVRRRVFGRPPRDLATRLSVGRHMLAYGLTAFLAFTVSTWLWQAPAVLDATVRSGWLHALADVTLLAGALVFWLQVVDSPPMRSRLGYAGRCLLILGTAVFSWFLDVFLAYTGRAYYTVFAPRLSRAGGLSPIVDQHVGVELLWAAGMVAFTVAFAFCTYRWLVSQDDADAGLAELVRHYGAKRGGVAATMQRWSRSGQPGGRSRAGRR
jgi:cytochrome c oxidase assembly factor CtaG